MASQHFIDGAATPPRLRRGIRALLIAILAAVVCPGCGDRKSAADDQAPARVQLQLNWKPEPQFGGFFAAELAGIYRRHGLDVTISAGGLGVPTVEMIGAGTVPFAIVSADEIVRARSVGNPVVALFAVYQTNPHGIMTRASRGFQTLADVFTHKGTLGIERGLPHADFLEKKYGFQNLKLMPPPFGDLTFYRTDENYSMQCFITSEPLAAKKTGIEPRTFLIADAGFNPYATVLATSETYLKTHPAIVRSMIDAAREGWQTYLRDPAAANEHMQQLNPTMDKETFQESAEAQKPLIETEETRRLGLGAMTLERWQTLVDQLVDLKTINKPIDPQQSFFQPSSLK